MNSRALGLFIVLYLLCVVAYDYCELPGGDDGE